MARPALRMEVSTKDQKELHGLLNGGVQQLRVGLRALALLQLAKGVSAPRISATIRLPHRPSARLDIVISKAVWSDPFTSGHGPERQSYWTTVKNSG